MEPYAHRPPGGALAPGRRRRRRATPVMLLVVLALSAGSALQAAGWNLTDVVQRRAYVEIDGAAVAVPRPQASQGRVLDPVPVTTTGSHGFLHTTPDGAPVGYDPCRPVRFVLNPQGMPDQGQALIDEAVAAVSGASGLSLVQVATTDEAPVLKRALIQPERYGWDWAPILVAWSDEVAVPELTGQVAGVGGSAAVPGSDGDGMWLAAGRLVLDAPDVTALLERPDGYAQARAIVIHELAHVLGLDHVEDPAELMNPMTSLRTDLGPGDRQALALVGQVACES